VKRYLIETEVAEICRAVPETVRHWRKAGTGPTWIKAGRRVLYDEQDVVNWLERNKQTSGAA
jgi:DNA-binding transcriptional MerR regulator